MCGIAGYFRPGGTGAEEAYEVLGAMTGAIAHRGPDDWGAWTDPDAGVALGHRRLSILDLSPLGHQPMESAGGRHVVIFNGEIYNFRELRAELEGAGHRFRGHSDTEVLLAAVGQWGIRRALERFNGMFALALWDRQERELHFARDRVGEKPLYYGWCGDTLLFGSELKALRAHPAFRGDVDRDAVAAFVRLNYVPAPLSIYRGIHKLPPATLLTVRASDTRGSLPVPEPYWSLREVAERGARERLDIGEREAEEQLDVLLRDAVRLRMEADVPLGAFLSGGIDSTAIVALMQAQSAQPVRTFTIGFHEAGYNEAEHAAAVAGHLRTDHTELYVTSQEAMSVVPDLPVLYDEPFADQSQIPTFLVSRLARGQVTVSLSGDAGDELFGGYSRYFWGRSLWRKIGWLPPSVRRAAASMLRAPSVSQWNVLARGLGPLLKGRIGNRSLGERLHQGAELLRVQDIEGLYLYLVSHWTEPERLVQGGREPLTPLTDRQRWARLPDAIERMMYLDTLTYLSDEILVKVDRASMGVSLEARVPLLDPRVIEFAWRLPTEMKLRGEQGKWLLRRVVDRYVPRELMERPKMGFGVPVDRWLRGPLRPWAEELLDERRLREDGFFDPAPVRQRWREHLEGKQWHFPLWDVLMFQAWLQAQSGPARTPARAADARRAHVASEFAGGS